MELSEDQISFIRKTIRDKGLTINCLVDSLVDHVCCVIENSREADFQTAYMNAMASFGENGILQTERDTILLLILKRKTIMKKTMFLLGYVAALLITTGVLFKLQHWPFASIMLTLGIVLLNFGFLPMFFYDRYKRSMASE